MRIVLLTPFSLGMNPRVVKEATALHEAGHEVLVISTRLSDAIEPRDRDILALAPWRSLRLQFHRSWSRRAERLLQEGAKRLWPLAPGLRGWAINPVARRLAAAAQATPADLYVAHYPASLPAAAQAAKRWNARYAFDAEDFHPGDLPDTPEHSSANTLVREIEAVHLPGAAYVTAASPGIADAYAMDYGIAAPSVVLNTFPVPQSPAGPTAKGSAPGPSVYWFSQTIGPDRGLEVALEAIAFAETRPHLYLRGTPRSGYAETIRAKAANLGCADRLHLLPAALPSQMEALAAQFDMGLVAETGVTRNRRIALTNKQFTYLLAGLPVLLSNIPSHREFARDAGGAAFVYEAHDARDLAHRMDAVLGNPDALAKARVRAFALGRTRFNWATEAPKLLSAVETALTP